jgi:glycosyltransferase involved in cell wall biosynthesis
VVVPCRDRKDIIGPTLDSILAQTFDAFEVIVVDDGSTDGLGMFLAERYPSVRVLRLEASGGCARARNRGVAIARGELIALCDSDDLWSPDKLQLQIQDFDEHAGAVLSFTDITPARDGTEPRYSRTQPFEPGRVLEQLLEGGPIMPSSVLMRKSDFDAVGGFDPDVEGVEDRDLWLRLAARGPIRFLPSLLVRRVVYGDAMSHEADRWEGRYIKIVTRFLDRPEGAAFRRRARRLYAFQYWKIGARFAVGRDWKTAAGFTLRALRLDPLALLRRPGRRLLTDVRSRMEEQVLPRFITRRRRKRKAAAVPPMAPSYRLPPPAPR